MVMAAKSGTHIDDLARKAMILTDREGKIIDREGNPFSASLTMEYKRDGLYIWFHAFCSPHSNGNSQVKIKENEVLVFEAEGKFVTSAYNMQAKTYAPGAWEQKI
jgi:hypothetical protein